ncbi:MAG: hypothetical protein ACRD04_05385 [Terriglobales bacterium]
MPRPQPISSSSSTTGNSAVAGMDGRFTPIWKTAAWTMGWNRGGSVAILSGNPPTLP